MTLGNSLTVNFYFLLNHNINLEYVETNKIANDHLLRLQLSYYHQGYLVQEKLEK